MSSDSEMSKFSDMSGNPEDEDVEEGNDEDYDVFMAKLRHIKTNLKKHETCLTCRLLRSLSPS